MGDKLNVVSCTMHSMPAYGARADAGFDSHPWTKFLFQCHTYFKKIIFYLIHCNDMDKRISIFHSDTIICLFAKVFLKIGLYNIYTCKYKQNRQKIRIDFSRNT